MNAKPHLSQVEKLDRLLSDHEGEWVPLPEVLALGIAAYSRRFEDLRALYKPQGFIIENKLERGHDGVTRSWYRKVRDPWRARLADLTKRSQQAQPQPEFQLVP